MKTLLFVVVTLVIGAAWFLENAEAASLRAQVAAQRQQRHELSALRERGDRLRTQQPTDDEFTQLQRAAAERAREGRAEAEMQRHGAREALVVGEWVPMKAWKNRGTGAPLHTVETLLWAAAGGDVEQLRKLLILDDPVRSLAEQLFERLPAASRSLHTSAEQLLAAYTAKAIPVGDAQLVWQHRSSPEEAIACLWLTQPEAPAGNEFRAEASREPNAPPSLPASRTRKVVYLPLRLTAEGWRVVVPARTVENLGKEIGGR